MHRQSILREQLKSNFSFIPYFNEDKNKTIFLTMIVDLQTRERKYSNCLFLIFKKRKTVKCRGLPVTVLSRKCPIPSNWQSQPVMTLPVLKTGGKCIRGLFQMQLFKNPYSETHSLRAHKHIHPTRFSLPRMLLLHNRFIFPPPPLYYF